MREKIESNFLGVLQTLYFSPFSERSAAARGVGKFVPNNVNIVCRLIYLFILLSYIWKIGNYFFPNKNLLHQHN